MTEIIARHPKSVFSMGKRLLKVLPTITKLVDFAVDWMQFGSGQTVYNRGDERYVLEYL